MTADTFSPLLGLTIQGTGNNNNSWGDVANVVFQNIEKAIAGLNTLNVTGGTLDLSGSAPPSGLSQALHAIQVVAGTLTSNQTIIVPNLTKKWTFYNFTSGDYQVFVKAAGGSVSVQIPQGAVKNIFCVGSSILVREDDDQVGQIITHAGITAPVGTMVCDGRSLLRADYPTLYSKIGTTWGAADGIHFNIPLLNDTSRYLRSSSTTFAVGTYQADTVGPHGHPAATYSGTTTVESVGHTHSGTATGTAASAGDHVHSIDFNGHISVGASGSGNITTGSEGQGSEFITAFNTQTAGAHTHTVSATFTTGGVSATHTHDYSGSTSAIPNNTGTAETRPQSAVVLMCIKY